MSQAGSLRRAAVLGHPIEHSLSPALHRAAYQELGVSWTYEAIDVTALAVADFVSACGPEWAGLSLTMPLKEAVLPVLDIRTPVVELTQAANTVIFDNGLKSGHNTDVSGIVAALQERHVVSIDSATILGSGATARSAMVALHELGSRELAVVARDGESSRRMHDLGTLLGLVVEVVPWSQGSSVLDRPVVMNTAPAEVAGQLAPPQEAGFLFDAIYYPWPTPLASNWAGEVLSGLDLLVHQALGQVELMTGATVPIAVLRAALNPR
ncbi:MAG: shikimate dehydrogenase [Actinobacteria bacterium]|nr:shikimate dehydrogenase [Actinomycetota bacterium]